MITTISILIVIFSLLFLENIIFHFIKDHNLAALSYNYAKVFIIALPLIAPLYAFDNFLRICGKVKRSMWINIIVSILNILLTIIFIGYLKLGITYAAISTVIGMSFGSILSVIPFIRNKLVLKFVKPRITLVDIRIILYNGSSEFFEGISGSIMNIFTNTIMLIVAGAAGVAAISIIGYIELLLVPILYGFIGSTEPIISFNYGAKEYKRLSQTFKITCVLSAIISLCALCIMLIFPEFLVSLFSDETDIQMRELATTGLLLYAPSYLFTWFVYIAETFFTALEKPKESLILMQLESFVFPIIFFIILTKSIGAYGMFLAQTLASFCAFLSALYLWKKVGIKLNF